MNAATNGKQSLSLRNPRHTNIALGMTSLPWWVMYGDKFLDLAGNHPQNTVNWSVVWTKIHTILTVEMESCPDTGGRQKTLSQLAKEQFLQGESYRSNQLKSTKLLHQSEGWLGRKCHYIWIRDTVRTALFHLIELTQPTTDSDFRD